MPPVSYTAMSLLHSMPPVSYTAMSQWDNRQTSRITLYTDGNDCGGMEGGTVVCRISDIYFDNQSSLLLTNIN